MENGFDVFISFKNTDKNGDALRILLWPKSCTMH